MGDKVCQFITRSSNYVNGHGSYIIDWQLETPNGRTMVFQRLMRVSRTVAMAMVQEAIATNCQGYPEDMYGCEKWTDEEGEIKRPETEHWMKPGNKDFLVLNVEHTGLDDTMTVLYNHDCKYTLYRASMADVKLYIAQRQKMIPDTFRELLNL